MTTIAYKDGVIAVDSRAVSGGRILSDNFTKVYRHSDDNRIFWLSGAYSDAPKFVQGFDLGKGSKELDAYGFMWDIAAQQLWQCGGGDEDTGTWAHLLPMNEWFAVGSGASFAITAMDLGCSVRRAIQQAMKRDTNTGGKIRTYKLAELK